MPSRRGSPTSTASLSSSDSSEQSKYHPIIDEQFLPRIVAIFYSIFHPTEGAKVVYQVPEEAISTSVQPQDSHSTESTLGGNRQSPIFEFKNISEFIIPKAPLCGRLISYSVASTNGQSYKILSHPVIILDQAKYPRKSFIFNVAFVFDGRADTRSYEPIVRKCARELRDLETSSSFLSKSQFRMYVVIEQLFEDLNSYCESFVALPEAPHTKYANEALKGAINGGRQASALTKEFVQELDSDAPSSPFSQDHNGRRENIITGQGSITVSRDGLLSALEQSNDLPDLTIGEPTIPTEGRPSARRSSTDYTVTAEVPVSASLNSVGEGSLENKTTSNRKDSTGSSATSPNARPSMGRSKTLAALAVSETTVNAVSNPTFGSVEKGTGDSVDIGQKGAAAMSRALSNESASTVLGGVEQHNTSNQGHSGLEVGLDESIMSLRTVDATTSVNSPFSPKKRKGSGGDRQTGSSVGAVPPAAMLAPGKREPPHGLGRTVRDAINLKLFPTYPNPKDINDWDVPVTLLDLRKRVTGNWDLTMCRVLPFIDGINHVKRIAQLADADLELTRQCIEHLLYYRCIITIDTFQFTNMYTVRPSIAVMAEDEVIITECALYVTKPDHPFPPWPKLLALYSSLRPAVTINDWMEENDVEGMGIDVRRFVSFGVIKGFLRRVHRYPVLLQSDTSPPLRGSIRIAGDSMNPEGRRDQSNSRSRERVSRVKEEDMAYSSNPNAPMSPDEHIREAFAQRAGRHGPRQVSENESIRGVGTSVASSGGGRRRGIEQGSLRKTRATVMDVANVALEAAAAAKEHDSQGTQQGPARVSIRTPLPRGGSNATLRASAMSGSRDSEEGANMTMGGSSLGVSLRAAGRQATIKIPPGFIDLLDGTHPDDEFCVRFGMSWNEVFVILVMIGKQPSTTSQQTNERVSRMGEEDEEGGGAAGAQSGWTVNVGGGGGEGDESGIANLSGIYGPGTLNGPRKSIGGTLPRNRRTSQQIGQAGPQNQSGFSRYASTGDATSVWGKFSGIQGSSMSHDDHHQVDRERLAKGDLGRVKVIFK